MTDKDQKSEPRDSVSKILGILEPLDEVDRGKILAAVHAYFQPTVYQATQANTPPQSVSGEETATMPGQFQNSTTTKDIRTLREEKQPKSDIEMAAVMAYYLKELAPPNERKNEVSAKDVEIYFNQAGAKLPKNSGQTLRNAKNAGYFESAGEGQFKLNPVGNNLVTHYLPKSSSDSKPKKKRPKKSVAKKAKTRNK